MKKLLVFMLVLLGFVTFDFQSKDFNSDLFARYGLEVQHYQNDFDSTFQAYLSADETHSLEEQIDRMIEYAEMKNLPLVFRTNAYLDDETTISHNYYVETKQYQYTPLPKKYYYEENKIDKESSVWATTDQDYRDAIHYRYLHGIKQDQNQFYDHPVSALKKQIKTDGQRTVIVYLQYQKGQYGTIRSELMELFGDIISINPEGDGSQRPYNDYMEKLLFCLILLTINFVMYTVFKKDREIAILALHGKSPIRSACKTAGKLLLLVNGVFACTLFVFYVCVIQEFDPLSLDFLMVLVKDVGIVMIPSLLLLGYAVWHCAYVNIEAVLKGTQKYHYFFYLNLGLKIAFVFVMAFPLYESSYKIYQAINQIAVVKEHESFLSDYGTVDFEQKSHEFGNESANAILTALPQDTILYTDSLYLFDDSPFQYCTQDGKPYNCDAEIAERKTNEHFIVNHNMVKQFPVYDVEGNKVELDERITYTLVPQSMEEEVASFPNIILVKDDTKLPNFSYTRYPHAYVSGKPIMVIPNKEIEDIWNVLIPVENKKDFTSQLKEQLSDVTGIQNVKGYQMSEGAVMAYEYYGRQLKEAGMQLLLCLFIMIFVSYQNGYLFFHVFQKELAISYLHGKSYFRCYRNLYILQIASVITGLVAALMVGNIIGKMLVVESLCFGLIEIIFTYVMIHRFERNFHEVLKGDE